MLDNCSQGSFIKDEIIEDLGILNREMKLSLKTLTGEISEDTEAADGLYQPLIPRKEDPWNG